MIDFEYVLENGVWYKQYITEKENGECVIEREEIEIVTQPTQLDRIEAQVTYTAMMTDTLLEVQDMKDKIIKWYKQGLWSFLMVRNAVEKNILTPEDFKEITNENY